MTATPAQRFPLWDAIRGVGFLLAAYAGAYNITHDVKPHQWFFPLILVAAGFATTIFEDLYDTSMTGGFLGPLDMQNATCMALAIGLPAVSLIAGIAHGSTLWWLGGLLVLLFNSAFYFGFRQQGLPILVVAVCLLGASLF